MTTDRRGGGYADAGGSTSWSKRLIRHASIVAASALPRLLYALWHPPDPSWGSHYWPMSTSVRMHGVIGYDGVPSTDYEPLYPLFLALARYVAADHLFVVLSLQALLCSIGAVYFFELAFVLTRSFRTAAIAAAMFSFYPYLVAQGAALEEVSLLTTLLIGCTFHYVRSWGSPEGCGHALASGALFGLALLTRVTILPVLIFAVFGLFARRRPWCAWAVGGLALLIYLPYAARNHRIDGSILPTRGGYNLLKAHCEYSDAVIPTYMIDVMNAYVVGLAETGMPGRDHASEREIDRFYMARALDFIEADPAGFLRRVLRYAGYLFHPRLVPFHPIGPSTTVSFPAGGAIVVDHAAERGRLTEISYTASYTPLLVAALFGVYGRRREAREDFILYAIVASFVLVYSVYAPATRVRAPMDFVILFFAACAVERVLPKSIDDHGSR